MLTKLLDVPNSFLRAVVSDFYFCSSRFPPRHVVVGDRAELSFHAALGPTVATVVAVMPAMFEVQLLLPLLGSLLENIERFRVNDVHSQLPLAWLFRRMNLASELLSDRAIVPRPRASRVVVFALSSCRFD